MKLEVGAWATSGGPSYSFPWPQGRPGGDRVGRATFCSSPARDLLSKHLGREVLTIDWEGWSRRRHVGALSPDHS